MATTQEQVVIIVGAGPSGLSLAACLNQLSIPNLILEKQDCYASIWKKYSYDRLHLHLPKQFCNLPHIPFPNSYPTYISKNEFTQYLDDYVSHFNIAQTILYKRNVELATFDDPTRKWIVKVRNNNINGDDGIEECYFGRFLVVATGEFGDPFIPKVFGLETFSSIGGEGILIHSTQYKNGEKFKDKSVLVVGGGNSGMEIALDLANYGAKTSIAIRSPMHIMTKEMSHLGLLMLRFFSYKVADFILVMLSKLVYGDISKYFGVGRPKDGPFVTKFNCGKYPVVDVGTYRKIQCGEIQVLPAVKQIGGKNVLFENGYCHPFDAIVFATGFKRSTHKWLKGDDDHLNEDGLPKQAFPNHWKGKNGLYCVGLAQKGLFGIGLDAQNVARDINTLYASNK